MMSAIPNTLKAHPKQSQWSGRWPSTTHLPDERKDYEHTTIGGIDATEVGGLKGGDDAVGGEREESAAARSARNPIKPPNTLVFSRGIPASIARRQGGS
jgi:hypothetical protein